MCCALVLWVRLKIPNLPAAAEASTHPAGGSNSGCLPRCLGSLLLSALSYFLFHISVAAMSENEVTKRTLAPLSLSYLPPSEESSAPGGRPRGAPRTGTALPSAPGGRLRGAPRTRLFLSFFIRPHTLAQTHTLFCLLFLIVVHIDAPEDDDKIRKRPRQPWEGRSCKRVKHTLPGSLVYGRGCWTKTVRSQLIESPCLQKDRAPHVSSQSHNLTFSIILSSN